jgi:adenosylcobinamide-phosphate synthase
VTVDDAWMGDGRAGATAADVRRALGLFARACVLVAALTALALALLLTAAAAGAGAAAGA